MQFFFHMKVNVSHAKSSLPEQVNQIRHKPSVPVQASTLETKQVADARAHEFDNMRFHLRLHDKWTDHCSHLGLGHHVHEVCRLAAPSATSLNANNNQLATTSLILSTSRLSPFLHGGALPHWCALRWYTEDLQQWCTTQRDVDGLLCSVMEKQTLNQRPRPQPLSHHGQKPRCSGLEALCCNARLVCHLRCFKAAVQVAVQEIQARTEANKQLRETQNWNF